MSIEKLKLSSHVVVVGIGTRCMQCCLGADGKLLTQALARRSHHCDAIADSEVDSPNQTSSFCNSLDQVHLGTNHVSHMNCMITSSNGNIFRVTGPLYGEFTGPGEFPAQRPVTRSCDVFFDLRLNKRLNKQPWGWWFETQSWSLWRQCNWKHMPQTQKVILCAQFDTIRVIVAIYIRRGWQCSVFFHNKMANLSRSTS